MTRLTARHERGFALLIVLWLLVPVSTLLILMAGAARSDSQLTANLRVAAALQAAADGGIETALPALLRTNPEMAPVRMQLNGADVAVRITSLSGMVNPNVVTPEFMRSLLIRLGAPATQAEIVAIAILDWRLPGQQSRPGGAKLGEYRSAGLDYGPPGAPFESVDEVREVLDMTPPLFAALRPLLTLYTDGPPNAALASPVVLAALRDVGPAQPAAERATVFAITAEARGAGSARVVRRMTVKIGSSPNGRPWRVLAWETPSGD